ncbi:MAG: D-alanyl-D-alanine carboxypeptidase [Bacilli bacterium]|nr:D-alanyl-D-alanine carboxypeptidase [Bacilli bacterium]
MKKILLILILFFITSNVYALDLAKNAKSTILIESSTGEIIYERNADEKLAPASMTKMMSLILIMEAIENGNIKLDQIVTVSENASKMGGSQIYLEANEKMSVDDLLKGICMASANDAVVALAETIYGSESEFVNEMNKKSKKLGLTNTNFMNATGLDEENHYSSARDMAFIARELIKHDKVLDYSSRYEDYLRENTNKKFWLVNTNKLIKTYEGMDGLKTGYTESAGYCLTATAKRNNMRLIGVVMKEESSNIRNSDMTELLNYGFSLYKVKNLLKKNKTVSTYEDNKSSKVKNDVIVKEDINILNKKNSKERKVSYKIKLDKKSLPIEKDSKIGTLEVIENNKVIYKTNVYSKNRIKKANIFELYLRNIKDFINGKYIFN